MDFMKDAQKKKLHKQYGTESLLKYKKIFAMTNVLPRIIKYCNNFKYFYQKLSQPQEK